MSNRLKNTIYSLILIILMGGVYLYRKSQAEKTENQKETEEITNTYLQIQGEAQGTTYTIKYEDKQNRNFKPQIDSLLKDFDNSLSTWDKTSDISLFNQPESKEAKFRYPYFHTVLERSREIYELSNGAFDPTVAPLVNAYGFGFKKADTITPELVDSLRQFVSFDFVKFDKEKVVKEKMGVSLDFNAIAQGYSVDVLALYLEEKGITNFMIELGGEVVCKGVNQEGKIWTIGIKNPILAEQGEILAHAVVSLNNKGLATSGNYEKFYIKDGKKYAHTLNPKTGHPVTHSVLSATVIAHDAMTADGLATVFMVIGLEEGKKLIEKQKDLDVYLIYADEHGSLKSYMTEGMKQMIQEINNQ